MKIISPALVFLLAVVAHAETAVSVTHEVNGSIAVDIEQHIVALLISCDYEAPSDVATEALWNAALQGSNARTIFSEPRKFSFVFSTNGTAKKQEVAVKEILIPVSAQRGPDYILILCDNKIRAFAKYHNQDALFALQKSLTNIGDR
jgi:hypothetical protein